MTDLSRHALPLSDDSEVIGWTLASIRSFEITQLIRLMEEDIRLLFYLHMSIYNKLY